MRPLNSALQVSGRRGNGTACATGCVCVCLERWCLWLNPLTNGASYFSPERVRYILLAASSGKRNVTVWRPSIRLSVCPVVAYSSWLTRASIRRGQCSFPFNYYQYGHTYCDHRVCMFVCLFVCLYVRWHISKTARLSYTKFSVHVTCGRGSAVLWRQCLYVMYFRFCRWRHIFIQCREYARIRDDAYVSSSSPGGGTGGEVCRLRLHLVFWYEGYHRGKLLCIRWGSRKSSER